MDGTIAIALSLVFGLDLAVVDVVLVLEGLKPILHLLLWHSQ